jgi:hypothetical protein
MKTKSPQLDVRSTARKIGGTDRRYDQAGNGLGFCRAAARYPVHPLYEQLTAQKSGIRQFEHDSHAGDAVLIAPVSTEIPC